MTHRRILRSFAAVGIALAAAGASTLATAGSASAATTKNGVLERGELGLYYNSDQSGAVFDLYLSDANFSNDHFPKSPGTCPNNNTASYHNMDSYDWYGFTGADASGYVTTMWSGFYLNLLAPYKNGLTSAYYYLPD